VLRAFQQGADGVLVAGCHPGDCHYQEGNLYVRRRFALLRTLFEYVGVEPVRFQVRWVSASEGTKFAEIVHEFTAVLERLGRQTKLARQQLRGW
jgi:coenzyme F420-reducing hydrogenase delta subunit